MKDLDSNVIYNKSFNLALDIVQLYRNLCACHKEYILSKQVLRSGTSIGANVSEALYAQTKRDFISKMHIALKEASETMYWIDLLNKSGFLTDKQSTHFLKSLDEITKILKSIITTSKQNLARERNEELKMKNEEL
jgi:four helix bundle protein